MDASEHPDLREKEDGEMRQHRERFHRNPASMVQSGEALAICKMVGDEWLGDQAEIMDVGSGKDGVLSINEAQLMEQAIMRAVVDERGNSLIQDMRSASARSFLVALRVYLAMHSSANADDGYGALDDGVILSFGSSRLRGADVKKAAGHHCFHRYLRCRADEVRSSISFILRRAQGPGAAQVYPLASETARLLRVHAATRFMADYPQYAFVGAEFCTGITPRVREVLTASKAVVLSRDGTRVLSARVPHTGVGNNSGGLGDF